MRLRMVFHALIPIPFLFATAGQATAQYSANDTNKRMVLVELYTSQGCDMCPTAESILGALAEKDRRIVPVAFHVDYFNDPWKDVFSDPLYSQRQGVYNQIYTKPKNPEYGLYYTPMMMIDGIETANGRDPAGAREAIAKAAARKPGVDLKVSLTLKNNGNSGGAEVEVSSRTPRAEGTPLLVCAVLREDGVVTDIPSGENAGKSLKARFPARTTKYDFIELDAKTPTVASFSFEIDSTWNRKNTRLAVFVQDKKTGEIHQSADLPWQATSAKSTAR